MKAYLKGTKLPGSPPPTKAVRINKKPVGLIELREGAVEVTERQKRMNQGRRSVRGGWRDDEVEILKTMSRAGYDYKEIAKHLPDRTLEAVQTKLTRLRKDGVI